MAVKKYYCVKRGKKTGVFGTWKSCKDSVDGYPGAEYKGFATIEEAREYLGELFCMHSEMEDGCVETDCMAGGYTEDSASAEADRNGAAILKKTELPEEGNLLAYVDGSYDDSLKKYAFGCVFLLPDGRIFTKYGNGDNEKSLQHRNVTGEMLGAMYAVRFAMVNGFKGIEIRYDYEGIEKWVTGEWRAKAELTGKYATSMREWGRSIHLHFTKVAAHTNVFYNELADKIAKMGLREGNGVPKVCLVEDMEEYDGTDAVK